MNYREFGSTGLYVSEIGFGCSHLGKHSADEKDEIRLLHTAMDKGINFFDTADIYSYGQSEELLGMAFRQKRDKVIIATKVGRRHTFLEKCTHLSLPVLQPVRDIQPLRGIIKRTLKPGSNFSLVHIKKSIEQSLKRLQTDYLDLYQLHCPSPEVIAQGDIFYLLDSLIAQGKIRFYGISVSRLNDTLLCLNNHNLTSLQINFNAVEHDPVRELFPLLKERKIAIIVRVPFARGLLTEKRKVHKDHYINRKKFYAEVERAEKFSVLFSHGSRTSSQTALKFILHHPQVSVVIPGTTTLKHLTENISSLTLPDLTSEELESIYSIKNIE